MNQASCAFKRFFGDASARTLATKTLALLGGQRRSEGVGASAAAGSRFSALPPASPLDFPFCFLYPFRDVRPGAQGVFGRKLHLCPKCTQPQTPRHAPKPYKPSNPLRIPPPSQKNERSPMDLSLSLAPHGWVLSRVLRSGGIRIQGSGFRVRGFGGP